MDSYLNRKFPQLAGNIQAFKERDATVREVCDDYEEICTWLAAHGDRSAATDPEQYADARKLKQDLEAEVQSLLEKHHVSTR